MSKPADLRLRLPWKKGDTHVLGDYRYNQLGPAGQFLSNSDHVCSPGHTQDCYALDVVNSPNQKTDGTTPFTTATEIYSMFGGHVVFAGWATGGWACYGLTVYVEQVIGTHVYGALYAHLSNRTTSTGHTTAAGDTIGSGGAIGLNDPIGVAGGSANTGCSSRSDGHTATGQEFNYWSTHLHFAIYQFAGTTLHADGWFPSGGVAVVPEPFIGSGVYENFAWFGGPMTATDVAGYSTTDTLPGGTWSSGSTSDNPKRPDILGPGLPVVYKVHVSSSHPIKEVHFTVGYSGWAKASNATDGISFTSPVFDPTQIWRIVGICHPGDSCWGGTDTKASDITFTWKWWDTRTDASLVNWLPDAKPAAPTGSANRVLCISFDVYDTSGAGNLAPNGTHCSSSILAGAGATNAAAMSDASAQLADSSDSGARTVTLWGRASGEAPAISVETGGWSSCAALVDGTVRCWGYNGYGELGDGTTSDRSSPVAVAGITTATAVSVGWKHACAVLADGTVSCWGDGASGQIGNGNYAPQNTVPQQVWYIDNATAVAAEDDLTCALLADGTAACWGWDMNGELGDGGGGMPWRPTPVAVYGVSGAIAITGANSGDDTCVLLNDGTVECWGDYRVTGTPTKVDGIANAVAIASGYSDTCALIADGSVDCWGMNNEGQLGNGTTVSSGTPVQVVGVSTAVALGIGNEDDCAVLADGTIRCWGLGSGGQLGDGQYVEVSSNPVSVLGIAAAVSVSAGLQQTCALLTDGSVSCWGVNNYGQLGDATNTSTASPSNAVVGVPAPTATHLRATMSTLFTAGAKNELVVTAVDGAGNVDVTYHGTVHITSTDPAAMLPYDYTFGQSDAGVASFSVTLRTAGTQSVTATDGATSSIKGSQTGILVTPCAAAHLSVATFNPFPAGSTHGVTVKALDAYGNVATGYTGTVHFTSSDSQASLPANYTFTGADNGVHTFASSLTPGLSLKTAGSKSVTATDISHSSITGSQTVTVTPGAAKTLKVSGILSVFPAGSTHSVTVKALDAYGNVATGYTGTIHFTSSDAQASLPANYTFTGADKGVHAFASTLSPGLTLKTAGSRSVTATDVSHSSIKGSETVTVTPGVAKTLKVVVSTNPWPAGSSHSVTVTALDAYGNVATGYTGTIHFTSSDTKAILPADYTFTAADKGVHTFPTTVSPKLTLKTAGSQWVRATDTGHSSITGSEAVTVQ